MPQGKISFEFCKCRITWDIKSKEEKKDVLPLFKKIQNLQFGEFACGIRNPAHFTVESGILGFGITNTGQGIRNPI